MGRMMPRNTRAIILVGAALLLAGAARPSIGSPAPPTPAVRLHADLPTVLDRGWIERLDLFPDVPGLRSVRFGIAPWGGMLARLEMDDPVAGPRTVVRNLGDAQWKVLRARARIVLAGGAPPPWPDAAPRPAPDPLAAVRSWPETAAPAAALPREAVGPSGPTPLRGRWVALIETGARLDVSGFNAFFTPMGQLGLAFGYAVTGRVVPHLGFHAGFGDMRGEFEGAFGDGRTNVFGFTLATLMRQPVSTRASVYAEVGVGYHIRSLAWGGAFYDPVTGRVTEGRVLEQKDVGWSARVGWLLSRDHPSRPRFLDVGLGLQTMDARQWVFWTDDAFFEASGRDTWIVFSVRFWDGL